MNFVWFSTKKFDQFVNENMYLLNYIHAFFCIQWCQNIIFRAGVDSKSF